MERLPEPTIIPNGDLKNYLHSLIRVLDINERENDNRLKRQEGGCLIGWYDYADLATQTTPQSISANTRTDVNNDGQGTYTTNAFGVPGIVDIYDGTSGEFDFSKLKIGDVVGIRIDFEYDTQSNNQTVRQRLDLAVGSASAYSIKWGSENVFKHKGVHEFSVYNKIYIGNNETRNNPAKFSIFSDGDLDLTVNGYFIDVTSAPTN